MIYGACYGRQAFGIIVPLMLFIQQAQQNAGINNLIGSKFPSQVFIGLEVSTLSSSFLKQLDTLFQHRTK